MLLTVQQWLGSFFVKKGITTYGFKKRRQVVQIPADKPLKSNVDFQ